MSINMILDYDNILMAVHNAGVILEGMGYTGNQGSIHLMDLKLQTNTITAILHNIIGWQIAKLDDHWIFHPKGGNTPDLTQNPKYPIHNDISIQIKVTSDRNIKGNKITLYDQGYYIVVKYKVEKFSIEIKEILTGILSKDDWIKNTNTQFAFVTKEAEQKLLKIF